MQGYWKWGGGFLDQLGFTDFAGSGVVHMCGAAAALAGVCCSAHVRASTARAVRSTPSRAATCRWPPSACFILWLGWFGFNGGSELKVSDVGEANAVALVFVNTNMAAPVVCRGADRGTAAFGKADLTMALNGALAGLVAITAEPLTPAPVWQR